jgi:hypothetical protein
VNPRGVGSVQFSVGRVAGRGDYDGARPCVPYPVLRELLVAIERRRWASFDFGGMDAVSADAVGGRPEVTL